MSFIVLDGPDGSGKSTQIKMLAEYLQSRGEEVICIREPGQTALGEELRTILLQADYDIHPLSEVFLFNAARSQLVQEVIAPALKENKTILCDRFYPSTMVYQGKAGGLNLQSIEKMCKIAIGDCEPDHVIILDVPEHVSESRLDGVKDRIESKGEDYHEKVRNGFLTLANSSERWYVFDATNSIEDVHKQIIEHLEI